MIVSTFRCGPDQPRIPIAFLKFAAILLTSCCCWSAASSDEEKVRTRMDEDSSHICCEHDNCVSYRGLQSKTVYGATCMPWYEVPKWKQYTPEKEPNSGLVSNYCRNPSGWKNAWCYVKLSRGKKMVHWENCALPNCTATEAETCCDGNCVSYRGKLSTTISGKKCLPWSDLPATHQYHPDSGKHPQAGLERNYCRNPNANHPIAWCYTKIKGTNGDHEWENCVLPYCTAKDTENCCEGADCTTYRGKLSTTRDGKQCLWWKNNTETHKYHPDKPENQNYGLQNNNYCRNPSNNASGAWCYTQFKSWPWHDYKWDWCYLPRCLKVKTTGCSVLDSKAVYSTKWDSYYCGSLPGDKPLYYGCLKSGDNKGTCWRQRNHGQDSWCYGGRNHVETLCNPNMSPEYAGKYCYEKAPGCNDQVFDENYEKILNDFLLEQFRDNHMGRKSIK